MPFSHFQYLTLPTTLTPSPPQEPPSDLKANLARSWATFSQQRIDAAAKPVPFKACLFGLSFFHSVMQGRKRFGFQGWSRAYGFNMGDLRICADVLESYITANTKVVPWQDLRYIFGEIMYGGHITDFFDRRTNNTYLSVILNEALCNRGELAPGLLSPDAFAYDYATYQSVIDKQLPPESPLIYGLHPNAEIGFLTAKAEDMFSTILRLEVGSGASGDGGGGASVMLRETLTDLTRRCPQAFDLITLGEKVKTRVTDPDGPYCVVVVQEATRLNALLEEISFTLDELQKGLNGQVRQRPLP